MKKLNLLVIAFIALLTFSCSKDDGPAPITIESTLTTSKDAFKSANNGDWIEITEEEYNNLATNLSEITKVGTTDVEYSTDKSGDARGAYTRTNHTSSAKIPKNGYVFAFKYKVIGANGVSGVKIKQSITANNNGFQDLGKALPPHSGDLKDVFFVLKGNNTSVNDDGYLGFFQPNINGYKVSLFGVDNNGAYYGAGDNSETTGQWSDLSVHYQGLSTTKKQW